jgi:primosomal protein N' (replication factor Y)
MPAAPPSDEGARPHPAPATTAAAADTAPVRRSEGDRRRVARIVPDVPALGHREFDYLVPPDVAEQLSLGALVRVPLHGRRVGGWVVADDVEPVPGVKLQPIAKVSSVGPPPEVVELTGWAAWRWAGRRSALLRAASPSGVIRPEFFGPPHAPRSPSSPTSPTNSSPGGAAGSAFAPVTVTDPALGRLAADAKASGQAVVRLPPAMDSFALVAAVAAGGPTLIVHPSATTGALLGRRLARAGLPVAVLPGGWASAARGNTCVIGARAGVWAPCPGLTAIVVLDAHDESLVEERVPTWSAWVVAAERARRAGVPCVLVSAVPTLEQLAWGRLLCPDRTAERAGWAPVVVIDRSQDDPREGMFSAKVVDTLRRANAERPVACILNRKGRARLLACRACAHLARCERCGAALEQVAEAASGDVGAAAEAAPGMSAAALQGPWLRCRRCRSERPVVCAQCGSTRMRVLRAGVTRLREELEALAGQPVGEVTADVSDLPDTALWIGTEALLHRLTGRRPVVVVFLDLDAELLAPRMRAAERSLALLARASACAGGRSLGPGARGPLGMVVIQTRLPHHAVIEAAVRADPGRLADAELAIRTSLRLPPCSALAELSGPGAEPYSAAVQAIAESDVEVLDTGAGRWIVRAPTADALAQLLAGAGWGTPRPRVEVDPLDV